MSKDINMKPGFEITNTGTISVDGNRCITVNNLEAFNEVMNMAGYDDGHTDFISCIGRWQPKGTKGKEQSKTE